MQTSTTNHDVDEPVWLTEAKSLRTIPLSPTRSFSLAADTVKTYQRRLDLFLTWWETCAVDRPLDHRLAQNFIAWVRSARESPTGHPPRPFSPLFCNTVLSAVRRWCTALIEIGRLSKNPFESLNGIRCSPRIRHRLLTGEEIRRILAGCRCDTVIGSRDYALLLLLLHGARETELVQVRIGDLVDLGPDGYEVLVWSKGKHRQESLVLTPEVRRALDHYLALRFSQHRRPTDAPLFATHRPPQVEHPLSARAIRKQVCRAVRRAGLHGPRLSSLAFRFSGGAQAYVRGAPARAVKRMLRHEALQRTRVLIDQVDRVRFGAERYLRHLFSD